MIYTARASREEGWWTVTVDEVPYLFTQARRLDQIPSLVLEAAQLLEGPKANDATVNVIPETYLPLTEKINSAREVANAAQEKATAMMREFARKSADDGLTARDIGTLLGVSHQYASKLVS